MSVIYNFIRLSVLSFVRFAERVETNNSDLASHFSPLRYIRTSGRRDRLLRRVHPRTRELSPRCRCMRLSKSSCATSRSSGSSDADGSSSENSQNKNTAYNTRRFRNTILGQYLQIPNPNQLSRDQSSTAFGRKQRRREFHGTSEDHKTKPGSSHPTSPPRTHDTALT